MGKTNFRELGLYYSGKNLYIGEIHTHESGKRVFVSSDKYIGVWLTGENTNAPIVNRESSIIVLKEVADENGHLDIMGLDEEESKFVDKLYQIGEMPKYQIESFVSELGARISARLNMAEADAQFKDFVKRLNEIAQEDESEA